MVSIDAREAKRIPARNRASLVIQGRVIQGAMVVNISLKGLYLAAQGIAPVGSPCEVAIQPSGVGMDHLRAEGKIVRVGTDGMAIQFNKPLEGPALDAIIRPSSEVRGMSWLRSYMDYFRVSQSGAGSDCERTFGIAPRVFKTITAASFVSCIPAAILPVWIFRSHIPAIPDWAKVLLSFGYGTLWLMVIHPLIDLGLIRVFRARTSRSAHT